MYRTNAHVVVVWTYRMDTDTSYLLKIHLLGNPKKSRKDVRCFSLEKVVDADFTNYTDLVQSIVL